MNILVFYPYIPYPTDRGTYQRTYHLLRALAREHTIHLLALSEKGDRLEQRPVFEEFCQHVEFVPFEHPRWTPLSQRLFDSTPTTVQHWYQPHIAAALHRLISTHSYDLAYVCDIVLGQYFLDRYPQLPVYIDRSRVDLHFQREQARTLAQSWRGKILASECNAKLSRYERRIAERCSAQIVCGPDDEAFIRANISATLPIKVLPNGADLTQFTPTACDPLPRDPQPTLIFCGAMDYTPNIDALRWYFSSIHRPLTKLVPQLQLLIVGRDPIPEIQAYATAFPNVTVTGTIPDVRPYYRRAWLHIVPLRIGGGTRLKIVESIATGTPVVSTTIGAQGLDLQHEHDILLADTPADFAEQTARALNDVALRATLDTNGQKTVHTRLAWPSLGRELSAHLTEHATEQRQRSGPPISLLGIPFDNVTMAQALERIRSMVASRQPHCIATANTDFLVQATHDTELTRILHDAHLILCDGTPLLWASRLFGNPLTERVAGSDLIHPLLAQAEQHSHRIFLLGGTPSVIEAAHQNLRQQYPNLEVAGTLSPPFKPLLEMDHLSIIRTIRAARPDILLVSFGCPKQEKWISMHYRSLGVPVCIGVGATIDFLAHHIPRAPQWMRHTGLEWLYRLAQEPRRLLKRYFVDFLGLTSGLFHQFLIHRPKLAATPPAITLRQDAAATILTLPSQLGYSSASHPVFSQLIPKALQRPVIIDAQQLTHLDSTGLALLCRLLQRLRAGGLGLTLACPSPALLRALPHLSTLVQTTTDLASALHQLASQAMERPVSHINLDLTSTSTLAWQGEVTAVNADEVWQITEVLLGTAKARGHGDIEIDLSRVRFMDSTGVSLMIRARKRAKSLGVSLRFIQPSAITRNVVQTLRLQQHLLEPQDDHPAPTRATAQQHQPAHTLNLDA